MKKAQSFNLIPLLVLVFLCVELSAHCVSTEKYNFTGGYRTLAVDTNNNDKEIQLKIYDFLDNESELMVENTFPRDTVFYGKLVESRDIRRLSRDAIAKYQLYKAKLPNGRTVKIDHIIKIRPMELAVYSKYISK